MKKIFLILLVSALMLSGCAECGEAQTSGTAGVSTGSAGTADYALSDGRYVITPSRGAYGSDTFLPYILIKGERFTIVQDVAVSYQPGGTLVRNGNEFVLSGNFAGEYSYAFTLIDDDTFRFVLDGSTVPPERTEWTDGLIFALVMTETVGMDVDQQELLARCPEYFVLDASKGLDVIVWQMANNSYSFGLMEHSSGYDWTDLFNLKGTTAKQMRAILSAYGIGPDDVYINPWQHPLSSYIPDYFIIREGEDIEAKKEAYIAGIRGMLFG